MVVYRLQFLAAAKTERDKLDGSVQLQFTKVLAKRLEAPRVPKAALAGMADCYKIKLRTVGYRLVYQVRDESLVLLTVAVGKRDRNAVYNVAMARLPAVVPEKTTKAMQAAQRKNSDKQNEVQATD
jgi:mRNA interferase RelE/StbE